MTQPTRVLVVTPHYPPLRLGGTELRARRLAKQLVAHGSDAQVLCVEHLSLGSEASCTVVSAPHEGILVHRLDLTLPKGLRGFEYSFDNPLIEHALDEIVRNQKIDLIHLISGYLVTACAIRVAHRYDLPVVVTLTDYWFICPRVNLIRSNSRLCGGPYSALDCARCLLGESRRFRLPEKALPLLADLFWSTIQRVPVFRERLRLHKLISQRVDVLSSLLNESDVVIIPTNSVRPRLIRAGIQDRFVLSRHSLDFDFTDYSKAIPKSASPGLRFGYIGQIQQVKGIEMLLKAFQHLAKRYPAISLEIWGDLQSDPTFSTKLSIMCRKTPRVKLCGRYEPGELPSIMTNLDVLVVPSLCPEIGPFVILEAFATRTPVIAANIGNIPELVENGVNGLLFSPGNSEDLQRQMERVLTDPTLYPRLVDGIPKVRTAHDEMTEIWSLYSAAIERRRVSTRDVCL